MDKKTLLIAEDAESNFMYLNILPRSKYNVVRAHNGQEAIDRYHECNPFIVLLDIKMPETDGLYAQENLRKESVTLPIMKEKLFERLAKYDPEN